MTLYPVEFVPAAVPGCASAALTSRTALTDSAGRLTLEAEAGSAYLLEGIGTPSSDSLIVWRKDVNLREDEAGDFRLEGIPSGSHDLLLLRGSGKTSERIKVSGWNLTPVAHEKLDTVTLGKPSAGESSILRRACVENPVLITEYPYEDPAVADRRERLRTMLETDPP